MEHQIVINTNSFPASSVEEARLYFGDALQGVLALNTGTDLFTFYLDSNGILLADFNLVEGFTYEDFVDQITDQDLKLFLLEVVDKSPAIDTLTEEQLEEVANNEFYIPEQAIFNNLEVFSFAWTLSGTLLSIPTSKVWEERKLNIRRSANDGQYIDEDFWLNNISYASHGSEIYEQFSNNNLPAVCKDHHLTQDITDWYDGLTHNNKRRVLDKLSLACERNFNGGEPLFKTLTDADGIREVRFDAYPGGTIRVLFKAIADGRQALLVGFIKKSNSEGYVTAIDKAKDLHKEVA
jgi:phage-related protein